MIRRPSLWIGALVVLCACASPKPMVSQRTYAPTAAALERVAVIPFYAHRSYQGERVHGGVDAVIATRSVTDAVATAIAHRGVHVLAREAVDEVVARVTRIAPAVDARILAEIAERELGASGIVLGEVLRFRDSLEVTSASRVPSSVAFQLALYDAPAGEKVWAVRFDETQEIEEPDLVSDPDANPPEPWLTAEEIARMGAFAVADALLSTR